ncbi:glycosyltransferase family 2 protein [Halomonas sp. SpR8]|uniref:glycosyltransferase family 2 protein n=1 Tax=Halomonas sp. SpR8 TaxID=3050463 RepID=UPI0027E3C2B6|nr:glycosyltransferase family 2 protein [Halomonas sp. SpR8]MDQ7727294.1 glycosyltransferase family 2 protein [Halomonas sp. SpR8]
MKLAIAAIVKNEIDSLNEWLAYHLAVGASHFLMADNESDDGTYELLESLAQAGLVTLISVSSEDGPPQLPAYQQLLEKRPNDIDLVAFIDADEYLFPTIEPEPPGKQSNSPLLDWLAEQFASPEVGALALNWACFGSNDAKFRDEGLVIERFTQRAKQSFGPNHHFKSIVRPAYVNEFANPHYARLNRGCYVNALGQPVEPRLDKQGDPRMGLSEQIVWEGARINHYLVKSVEEFVLGKSKRGSAATPNYQKQREYFIRHDRNEVACLGAAALAPKVAQQLQWLQQVVAGSLGAKQPPIRQTAVLNSAKEATNSSKASSGSFDLKRWLRRRLTEGAASTHDSDDLPLERWSLDYPSEQRGSRFIPSGRVVQGWLLLPEELKEMQSHVQIIAEWQPAFELCHPLEIDRPDVIENILKVSADRHPQRVCGFRFTVPPQLAKFRLWLAIDDQRRLLQEVNVDTQDVQPAQQLKVLKGKQGWLFLDNDTNGSVDQFMGRMRLTQTGLEGWSDYLGQVSETAANTPWALLVAPSKESVMGASYHPRKEGESGPLHQVLSLNAAKDIVYPVEKLKALGDDAFIPTDTHWTHKGARMATIALAEKLGIEKGTCETLFKKDRYKQKEMGGDLGNKLTPQQRSSVDVLTSFSHSRYKTYDNGLPNFGRLLVIEYPDALMPGTCLLFGSSSSSSMFNYLCRVFQRFVFVHSAGNIDPDVVAAVAPSYLAAQTNGRFVVQVPSASHSLEEVIRQKSEQLDEKALEGVREKRIIASDDYLQAIGLLPWEKTCSALIK